VYKPDGSPRFFVGLKDKGGLYFMDANAQLMSSQHGAAMVNTDEANKN
jgi:hypothetical protein